MVRALAVGVVDGRPRGDGLANPENDSVFIFGRQTVRRRRGQTADFCGSCFAVTAHRLIRVGNAFSLYFVPIGSGALVHFELKCRRCGFEDESAHASLENRRVRGWPSLESLVARTNPKVREVYAPVLSEFRDAADRHAPREARLDVIKQVLDAHAYLEWNQETERRRTRLWTWLAVIASAMVPILFLWTIDAPDPNARSYAWWSVALAAALIALAVGWRLTRQARAARHVERAVVLALAPIRPGAGELTEVLAGFELLKRRLDPDRMARSCQERYDRDRRDANR